MFKTRAEIDEYYDHDKIECLLCGKHFHLLTNHLRQKHNNMSRAEYIKLFGLPNKRPLCSPTMSRIAEKRTREKMNVTSKNYGSYRKWLESATEETRKTQSSYTIPPFLKKERKKQTDEFRRSRSIKVAERNKIIAESIHLKTGILAKKFNISCQIITTLKREIKEQRK